MKNNKKLTWLLGVLLLGVWGTIAHELVGDVGGDTDETENGALADADMTIERYVYDDDVRDPFYARLRPPVRHDTTKKKPVVPKQVLALPTLKLTGILTASKKRTAMIEAMNGTVFFLHEGDTLQGVKLTKMTEQTV
jgi:hypothetical protein